MRPARAFVCVLLATLITFQSGWALGPFEKNHPTVEKGADAYSAQKYGQALDAFDAARRELPGNAAVDLNRGSTLYKMERYEEARDAFLSAQKSSDPKLQQKAAYNLGNTYAKLKQRDDAIRSYRRALRLDPTDQDARHNLETILRNTPPPPPPQDGGTDGGSPPDAGQGSDAGSSGGDAGVPPDGGSTGQGDGGSGGDGGSPPDGGSSGGENQGDGGLDGGSTSEPDAGMEDRPEMSDGGIPPGLSREEALRLLDAMKQNEKNLQMWKFQQKRRRKTHEKDW